MTAAKQARQYDRMGRFLVEHEACGEGFDVESPGGEGSGVVAMTCRGCGESFEYTTATIEIERSIELEPLSPGAASPAPAAVTPAAAPGTGAAEPGDEAPTDELEIPSPEALAAAAKAPPRKPGPPPSPARRQPPPRPPRPVQRRRPRPGQRRRERLLAGGLIGFAAVAIAFAALRFADGGSEQPQRTAAAEQEVAGVSAAAGEAAERPREPQPAERQPAAEQPAGEQPAGDQTGGTAAATDEPDPAAPGDGERLVETERFTIVVPESWAEGQAEGGLLLAPPGDAPVSVQVFFEENPGLDRGRMIAATAAFLRSRSVGGRVGEPRLFDVEGDPAFRLSKPGPLGDQTALGVLSGSLRYLVVAGSDEGAPGSAVAEARRALDSFRPR